MVVSHLTSTDHFKSFIGLLKSIQSQLKYEGRGIRLLSSLSHEAVLERQTILETLYLINKDNFEFFIRQEKMSVFEHYASILPSIRGDPDKTWVLLTDDDGEWHENRVSFYYYVAEKEECDSTVISIDYHQKEGLGSYVDHCVRLSYFRIFFEKNPPLQNPFCHLYFLKFICLYKFPDIRRITISGETEIYHRTTDAHREIPSPSTFEEYLQSNFDIYVARHKDYSLETWMKFILPVEIPEMKGKIENFYLSNLEDHPFHTKNIN